MSRIYGPPPKPTALKLLEGNPGHQKLNMEEPKCAEIAPVQPPEWLDVIGQYEYQRVWPLLTEMGLLSAVDVGAFEAYCDAYSTMVRMAIVCNELGSTYVTDQGQVRARPEATLKIQAANAVRQFSQEFGLTPSARGRMSIKSEEKETDEMESFLKRSRAKNN